MFLFGACAREGREVWMWIQVCVYGCEYKYCTNNIKYILQVLLRLPSLASSAYYSSAAMP